MDLTELPATPFRRHPWEVARARFFAQLVAGGGDVPAAQPIQVLDVGAGDGYLGRQVLQELPPGSGVTCVDANYGDDVELARLASPPVPGLTFARARPAGRFDVVLLLDVIEHVADDRAFLEEILEASLQPDGFVVVSVPAWDLLYGQHDLALKHFRRYQPGQCRALLQACRLAIVREGGLFHSLLFPRILQRIAEAARGARRQAQRPANLGEWRAGGLLSSLVTRALDVDTRLSAQLARLGYALPGLSYWALARRGSPRRAEEGPPPQPIAGGSEPSQGSEDNRR
jgi:SAM-dependent methyltransferase